MDWNDYRTILAIARSERIPAAAITLNVTTSTLFRKLEKIEHTVGEPLFTRLRGHYNLNDVGKEIALVAEKIEQEISQIERKLHGRDQSLQGKVTIAASEVLAPFFLARHLADIAKSHPNLKIQTLSGNNMVSLANGDADLAIRPQRPTDEQLFGRKLTDIRWAVYGATSQVNNAIAEQPAETIGFGGDPLSEKAMRLQLEKLRGNKTQLFSNNLILTASLSANSSAHCVLPLLLGEQWPGLTRLSAPFTHEYGELWIVCHKDLRNNSRVRIVFDHLIGAAKQDRPLFTQE